MFRSNADIFDFLINLLGLGRSNRDASKSDLRPNSRFSLVSQSNLEDYESESECDESATQRRCCKRRTLTEH